MKVHLFLTIGLAVGLVCLVSVLASAEPAVPQRPCDRYVLAGYAADTGDCSNVNLPCRTVQYAIDQALDGDVVCVADDSAVAGPTIYQETIKIPRSLTLDAKWEATCSPLFPQCSFEAVACQPENVVLDARGNGRVITIQGRYAPTIDCFTITGGDAAGQGGDPGETVDNDAGGGIYGRDAAPIIINNVITGNYGCDLCPASYGRGGGIYLLNAPATAVISGNLIARNVADDSTWGEGGGIMLRDSAAQVRHNVIQDNRAGLSAGDGGGIAVKGGTPTLADNEILHNMAGQSVMGLGGGIFVWSATPATIERNRIEFNQAIRNEGDLVSRGGGIYYAGNPTVAAVIRDNTLYANTASPISPAGWGGGIYVSGLVAPSLLSGNTLDTNYAGFNDDGRGGGLYVGHSEVTILDNDFQDNSASWAGSEGFGGGLYIEGGNVLLQGNSLTGNAGGGFPGAPSTAVGWGGAIAISDSLVIAQDNWIVGNHATNADASGAGGGIYGFGGTLRLVRNAIMQNRATPVALGFGGGLYLDSTIPWLDANIILDNVAAGGANGRGGGVRLVACSPFTLTNNVIAHNIASQYGSGVAVAASSAGHLAHNTIAYNQDGDGVGVYVASDSQVLLDNNLIVRHTIGIVNAGAPGSSVVADYTLFEDNTTNYGAGVVSSHEVAGPAALLADYHLGSSSGAIDHAPPLSWVTWDWDGDWRPVGAWSDVGADEYALHTVLPLVLRNAP